MRKISVYFILRRWKIWRSRGSVSHIERRVWRHRTLASASGVLPVLDPARLSTGRTSVSPVLSVRCAGVLRPSLRMGPMSTRRYRCLASGDPTGLQNSLRMSLVSTGRVRCSLGRVRWSAGDRWSLTRGIQRRTRGQPQSTGRWESSPVKVANG